MILTQVLKLSFLVYLLVADEVTLLDLSDTHSDDWYSSQNDQDDEMGSKKWHAVLNPFMFYVCQVSGEKQDNFLRTPYIRTLGATFVYVDIEYKLQSCTETRPGVERNNCAQSFHLHMKESDSPGELGRVDEYNYRLANDMVTAIVPDGFGTFVWKTVPVALSEDRSGVFFAIRDTGACIFIRNFLVKYRYCPDKVKEAVRYNSTILNGEDIQVTGSCVNNSTHPENEPPIKYCRYAPEGNWEDDFQKSNCYCDVGFALTDEICKECESGFYKKDAGNKEPCRQCPPNSVSLPGYTYKCECVEGFQRANENNVDEGCIAPPERPSREEIKVVNKDKFSISFEIPKANEGLQYKIRVSKKDGEQIYDVETKMTISAEQATIQDLEPDQSYVINFKVRNGSVESEPVTFYLSTESETNNLNLYIIIIACLVGVVVLILIVGMIVVCKRRKKQRKRKFAGFPDCRDPMIEHGKIGTLSTRSGSLQYRKYVPLSKYADPQDALNRNARSLDYSSISLERVCGQGQFGDVWKGTYAIPGCKAKDIAAKVLKDSSSMDQKREFLAEAAIMVQFEDPNVIELIGVVTRGEQFMIITEYMKNGCLKDYLKEIMGKRSVIELLSMARGIVSGMKYLSEMNFIHRDLAARNILVDERCGCKVSDFGLSRILEEDSQYYKPLGGKIPVRWTAPEAIVHCKYTQKSDVYSMGVVLWEIFTWGAEPWGSVSNDVVLKYLKEGIKLQRPEYCPDVVYHIMMSCWHADYTKRPTFLTLHNEFDKLIISSLDRNSGFPAMMDQYNSSDEGLLSVAQWLHGMGLSTYESHFMNTGWDTIDRVVLMDEDDLQKIGITLAGHQKKLKTAIDSMKAYTMSGISSHHNLSSLTPDSLPRYNTLPVHTSSPCLPVPKFGGTMT